MRPEKIITQLKTTEGETISDMTKIHKEIENYYKNFLTSRISQEKKITTMRITSLYLPQTYKIQNFAKTK